MKKTLLVLFVILLGSLFVGCNGEATNENNNVVPAQTVNEEMNSEDNNEDIVLQQKDTKLLQEAVSGDLDLSKCDGITDENLKNFCVKDIITTIAINKNDVSKCDQLKIQEDREYCRNKVPTSN